MELITMQARKLLGDAVEIETEEEETNTLEMLGEEWATVEEVLDIASRKYATDTLDIRATISGFSATASQRSRKHTLTGTAMQIDDCWIIISLLRDGKSAEVVASSLFDPKRGWS